MVVARKLQAKTNQANAARAGSTAIARPGTRQTQCIYAIDENGKEVENVQTLIVDGTFELLEESEEIFDRLKGYLAALAGGRGTAAWCSSGMGRYVGNPTASRSC